MTTAQHIGVLLAAGRGSRMGRTKQLLPWPPPTDAGGGKHTHRQQLEKPVPQPSSQPFHGGRGSRSATVVEAAFDVLAPHCAHMIVVFGHDATFVNEALAPRTFASVKSDPEAQMFHSIGLGLVEAQRYDREKPVLLHPADVPGVQPMTIQKILDAAAATDAAVMPVYENHGGHPVVIPVSLIDTIITWRGNGGLRAFWQQHPDLSLRLPVDDRAVVHDLDTPADYWR